MQKEFKIESDDGLKNISVKKINKNTYEILLDDKNFTIDAHQLNDHELLIKKSHQIFNFLVSRKETNYLIQKDNESVAIRLFDEDYLSKQRHFADDSLSEGAIKAPMPGKVVKCLVKKGQEVEKGHGVIVIEAMKMENELKAGSEGIIETIHVEEGQSVEAGQLLVSIG